MTTEAIRKLLKEELANDEYTTNINSWYMIPGTDIMEDFNECSVNQANALYFRFIFGDDNEYVSYMNVLGTPISGIFVDIDNIDRSTGEKVLALIKNMSEYTVISDMAYSFVNDNKERKAFMDAGVPALKVKGYIKAFRELHPDMEPPEFVSFDDIRETILSMLDDLGWHTSEKEVDGEDCIIASITVPWREHTYEWSLCCSDDESLAENIREAIDNFNLEDYVEDAIGSSNGRHFEDIDTAILVGYRIEDKLKKLSDII